MPRSYICPVMSAKSAGKVMCYREDCMAFIRRKTEVYGTQVMCTACDSSWRPDD